MHHLGSVVLFVALLAGDSIAHPVRTLERAPEELAWRTWLQAPGDDKQQPRRPTKSLFVAPPKCQTGLNLDGKGCPKVVTMNESAQEQFILQKLNEQFAASAGGGEEIDYDYGNGEAALTDDSSGPYQFSLPLGSTSDEKPDGSNDDSGTKKADQPTDLEAELASLKLETAPAQTRRNDVRDNHFSFIDKPKRESTVDSSAIDSFSTTDTTSTTYTSTESDIPETTYTLSESDELTEKASYAFTGKESTEIMSFTSTVITTTDATTIEESATSAELEDEEGLNRRELDGDSLKTALKEIGRYAEVTTDETYDEGIKTLGTRRRPEYYGGWTGPSRRYQPPRNFDQTVRRYPDYQYRYGEQPYRVMDGKRHLQDYWPTQRRHRHARRRADR